LRILLVHNFYRASIPSGENTMYRAEAQLLRDHGHEVREFTRSNDEEQQARLRTHAEAALLMPWNPLSAGRMRAAIAEFKPDIVHIHNTFPLLSPSVVAAAGRSGVPVICTLHNYRLFCAAAVLMRDGRPCTDCIDRNSAAPGLVHACYSGSRLKTLPLTATIAWHRRRKTWERSVRAFLAVSEYQKEQLVRGGLPADKIQIKPNFTEAPASVVPWHEREDRAIFIGRLTPEKGCETLIRAWAAWGTEAPMLEIVGDGVLRGHLEALAASLGAASRIGFAGQLPGPAVRERIAGSRLLVQPSLAPETFGLGIVEAFAAAVPVIASRVGAFPSIIDDAGWLFEAGNADALLQQLRSAWADPASLARASEHARVRYEALYSPEASYQQLDSIYADVIGAIA
jgi:glycosyltransferase involved in cell wall biosynthesis